METRAMLGQKTVFSLLCRARRLGLPNPALLAPHDEGMLEKIAVWAHGPEFLRVAGRGFPWDVPSRL